MDTDHAKRRGSAGLEKFIQKNWKQGKNTCFSSRPLGPYNCLFDNKNTANHNDKKPYSKCNRIALRMFEMKFIYIEISSSSIWQDIKCSWNILFAQNSFEFLNSAVWDLLVDAHLTIAWKLHTFCLPLLFLLEPQTFRGID